MNRLRTPARAIIGAALTVPVALFAAGCGQSSDDTSSASDSATDSATASDSADSETSEATGDQQVAAYYLTTEPNGDRITREFHAASSDGLDGAVEVLSATPDDPDYSNPISGWVTGAELGDAEITVTVDGGVPDGADAELAVQQVVYTVQAAAQDTLDVHFVDDSGDDADLSDQANPATAADQLSVLALVNVSDPAEGSTVSDSFTATGRASSSENNVAWEIRDADDNVVLDGYVTAEGDYMIELASWTTEIDVSSLEAGTYTFAALTTDESGGEEGSGASEDTKTITIE